MLESKGPNEVTEKSFALRSEISAEGRDILRIGWFGLLDWRRRTF
jgi:hypothetical protein